MFTLVFAMRAFIVIALLVSTVALVYYAWKTPEAKQLKQFQELSKILLDNHALITNAFMADRGGEGNWEIVVRQAAFVVKLNEAIMNTPGYPDIQPEFVNSCMNIVMLVGPRVKAPGDAKPVRRQVDYLKLVKQPQNEV